MDIGSALIEACRDAKKAKRLTHKEVASATACHEITSVRRLTGSLPMTAHQIGACLSACGMDREWLGHALLSGGADV